MARPEAPAGVTAADRLTGARQLRAARASSSADSAAVSGHIGLKLYHCSGAASIIALERVGDRLGRALDLGGRGRRHVDGRGRGVERRPSARRRIDDRDDRAPVFAASVAGPAGSVVHAPNRRTGMSSER